MFPAELLLTVPFVPDMVRSATGYAQMHGYGQDAKELGTAIKEDFASKESFGEKVVAAAAIGGFATTLGLEWGPTNEGLLAWVAGQSLAHTHGIAAPLEIGAKTGATAVALQSVYGSVAMGALRSVPNFVEKSREIKEQRKPSPAETLEDQGSTRDSVLKRAFRRANRAFVLGSSLMLSIDHANESDRSVEDDLKSIGGSALGVGSYVVGIATTVGLSHYGGPEVSSFVGRNITKGVIIGVLGGLTGKNVIKAISNRKNRNRPTEQTSVVEEAPVTA